MSDYRTTWCKRRGIDPRLYTLWCNMRRHCQAKANHNWKWYGARGIAVCKRWNTFANFAADMGPHPGKGWSLDRINNSGDYRRGNCQWATQKTQCRKSRWCKLTLKQARAIERRCLAGEIQRAIAKEFNVVPSTITWIMNHGTWH